MASTLVAPRSAVAAGLSAYRRGLATAAEPYDVAVIGGGASCLILAGRGDMIKMIADRTGFALILFALDLDRRPRLDVGLVILVDLAL
jgi:hypothetical protein